MRDTTRLEFTADAPQTFTLAIRHPAWCPAMTVTVNGRRQSASRRPGAYYTLQRTFRSGDVIEVRTPMSLRLEPLPDDPDVARAHVRPDRARRRGSARQGLTPGSQLIVNERESGKMLDDKVTIPRWTRPLDRTARRTRRARTRRRRSLHAPRDSTAARSVELIPWFRLTHERYNLYWQRQHAWRADLRARTATPAQPGAATGPPYGRSIPAETANWSLS